MYNKVVSFLDSNNSFYHHQYGFRKKHSTIHPILHLLNLCSDANNKKPREITLSVFCDLSKAFDVIDHTILLKKLKFYGIRGIVNDWFRDYLTNRYQYVEIENSKSTLLPIDCGVPQGSILGPLLYLIYVNDIANSTNGTILSFADDTSLVLSNSNPYVLYNDANIAMNNLYQWFCANKLSLNASKTKYIVIRPTYSQHDLSNFNITINDTIIQRIGTDQNETSTKFLGISIDEHLTWKHHISNINSKISRALFTINQSKHVLLYESRKTLYSALIEPHLSYGILAWGTATQTILHKTEILQKRALRTINLAQYNSHTDPLYRKSEILKIRDMYTYQVLLFMFKYHFHTLPRSFDNIFKYNHEIQGARLTRQANLLYVERGVSTFSQNLPQYSFPMIWNGWTHTVSQDTSQGSYKKNVKQNLLKSYSETVRCNSAFCNVCRNRLN